MGDSTVTQQRLISLTLGSPTVWISTTFSDISAQLFPQLRSPVSTATRHCAVMLIVILKPRSIYVTRYLISVIATSNPGPRLAVRHCIRGFAQYRYLNSSRACARQFHLHSQRIQRCIASTSFYSVVQLTAVER